MPGAERRTPNTVKDFLLEYQTRKDGPYFQYSCTKLSEAKKEAKLQGAVYGYLLHGNGVAAMFTGGMWHINYDNRPKGVILEIDGCRWY